MIRRLQTIANDILRVRNYIASYPQGHWFRVSMISKLLVLQKEYNLAEEYWESIGG